ncbi:MAG: deoxyguanosinetriphosphate triphosphohydrolase [Lentisphaeria bacterium]|nr:deoxyguanosinetriphosphate triphosphohydrolase [Lentisphaeria bacterium]
MAMNWKSLLSPDRLCTGVPGKITQERSPFQRDFDRIVFSGSFRRLQDKTQVFPLVKTDYVRTRLTHSLETSSIGRSLGTATGVFICENFDTGGATPSDIGSIVAAAALAHDIGNPPLGHAGEEAIRHWFTNSESGKRLREKLTDAEICDVEKFEGNAQGFRVLSRLEMPDQKGGMQLTSATLGTFSKYPVGSLVPERPSGVAGKKFGYFQSEKELFAEVAASCGLIPTGEGAWVRHPLAYLVEAADDIAYLIVDFEDGHRLGLVDYLELEMYFLQIINSERTAEHVATLDSPIRKAEFLRAQAIGYLVRQVTEVFISHQDELLNGTLEKPLVEYIPCRDVLNAIRQRSARGIYNHRSVAEVIGAGFEMVSGLLDIFVPCVDELAIEFSGGPAAGYRSRRLAAMLPFYTVDKNSALWRSSSYQRLMSILDFVSGMTDGYAVSLHQKLKGISL